MSALVVMALGAFDARAERTVVSGVAKSYAGKELALKCFSDQIVYTERLLANSVVDESGNFTFVVDVDSPVQAFVPMDVCQVLYILSRVKLIRSHCLNMRRELCRRNSTLIFSLRIFCCQLRV